MDSTNKNILVSVVGSHAGETLEQIFERKQKEIEKAGFTFWLYKSHSAKPEVVQKLARSNKKAFCYFIRASSQLGARPTKESKPATHFSVNGSVWKKIPNNILVTGSSRSASALVLKDLKLTNYTIDLWRYSNYNNRKEPALIRLGNSTLPITKKSSLRNTNKMKSHIRDVVAVAELKTPFCVYLATKTN